MKTSDRMLVLYRTVLSDLYLRRLTIDIWRLFCCFCRRAVSITPRALHAAKPLSRLDPGLGLHGEDLYSHIPAAKAASGRPP